MYKKINNIIFTLKTTTLLVVYCFLSLSLVFANDDQKAPDAATFAKERDELGLVLPCVPIYFQDGYKILPIYDSNGKLLHTIELIGYSGNCEWQDVSSKVPVDLQKNDTFKQMYLSMQEQFKIKINVKTYAEINDPAITSIELPIFYNFFGTSYLSTSGLTYVTIDLPNKPSNKKIVIDSDTIKIKDVINASLYGNMIINSGIALTPEQQKDYKLYQSMLSTRRSKVLEAREKTADSIWNQKQKSGLTNE